MSVPLISVDAITVRLRDRWLLAGSTWRINSGEVWAVVGPNGAGKTTLAKAVAGIVPVVQGTVQYHGFGERTPTQAIAFVASDDRRELWRWERQLDLSRGFAGRFDDVTTVRAWLDAQSAFPIPPGGPTNSDWLALLDRLQLHALLDKPLMEISTGEMCRVLLGRELARRPTLLILDEPFEGLDATGRSELQSVLADLAAAGLTMVLIAHRPEEMLAATTHVLSLDDGRIVHAGPIQRPLIGDAPDVAVADPTPRGMPAQVPVAHARATQGDRSDVLIDMRTVTVRYGDTVVLNRLSWAVRQGEHWAVTGPNGAGKSTLLKLITGDCLQVHANRVRLFGKARGADQPLAAIRRRLGVVNQELANGYQKRLSAMDVVSSGFFDSVGLYRQCTDAQLAVASMWLGRLGMTAHTRTLFDRLSQGQRQMILIARAMVKSPQLLILDEPCAGLDSANRRNVLDLVESIVGHGRTGLIFVTHHESDMPGCITHRLRLDRGQRVG